MHGIPMVATSPVRHESPVGMNPVEIQGYEPPWKVLADFALHTDLDRLNPNTPHFQHLVNQVRLSWLCPAPSASLFYYPLTLFNFLNSRRSFMKFNIVKPKPIY